LNIKKGKKTEDHFIINNSTEKGLTNTNVRLQSQLEKDKKIIENWGELRRKSIFSKEEFNVKKINNYINNNINYEKPNEENFKEIKQSSSNPQFKKESPNMKFSLSFILKSYICKPKTFTGKKKLQVFSNLKDYLSEKMDLIYYLRTLYAIEITHSLLFNPFQKKLLEYPFKPNIFSSEDLHAFGLDKQEEAIFPKSEITDYQKTRKKENNFDKYDIGIFKLLPNALTEDFDVELNEPKMIRES